MFRMNGQLMTRSEVEMSFFKEGESYLMRICDRGKRPSDLMVVRLLEVGEKGLVFEHGSGATRFRSGVLWGDILSKQWALPAEGLIRAFDVRDVKPRTEVQND